MQAYVHSHIKRPDGAKECFYTTRVPAMRTAKGKTRVYWLRRWRTVRDAAKHPDKQLLIRDTLTCTRVVLLAAPQGPTK